MAQMSLPHSFQSHPYASSWFPQSADPAAGGGGKKGRRSEHSFPIGQQSFHKTGKGWKGRRLDADLEINLLK